MSEERCVPIRTEYDIVTVRQEVRQLCLSLNFSIADQTLVATCGSELARNIVEYAGSGQMVMRLTSQNGQKGITIVASDEGPGIADIDLAMKDGYSTSRGLGLGLPGCRRIMDQFDIVSVPGKGTTVTIRKWKR